MADQKKDGGSKKMTEQEIIASYKMVKGDYRLKVRVYEANDLIPAKAGGLGGFISAFGKSSTTADPLVLVEINKQKKYTKPKKKTLSPIFNEVFFFRLKGMDKEQLEGMTIKFTVMDKNSWVMKDSIIGAYELDLTSVYFALNHELYQIWLTLTDPTDEREGIMGYLKVTLECLGPDDEPNVHDVTTDKNPNVAKEKSFFSSKVKQEGHVVAMEVYRAEALAPMDMFKPEVDAYVMCKYSGIKNKSKQITSKNPEWNQKVTLGCMLPNQSKFIQVEVWDYDLVGSDDLVGNFKVPFGNIREKELKPRWGNLYGAPLSAKDNQDAELMTLFGQDLGSTYRGRIFYGLTSYNYGDPKSETKDLNFKFPLDPIPQSPQRTYLLRVDILEGHELPDKERAIVHVAIGPYMIKTAPVKIEGGRALWYEALPDKKVLFPVERDEIPDCIFYFADADEENRRHCFFRIKAKEILVEKEDDPNISKPRIIKLKEDRALDLLSNDEFPGFLFIKVSLFCVNPPPRPPLEQNTKTQDFQLRVHLYIGRNLPPADEGGVSDPFVIIRCAGNTIRSTVKSQTLNPGWYETLTLDVTLPAFEENHVPSGMMVALYDADDEIGEKRDLLGRTWVTFQDNFVDYKITKGESEGEMVEMIYRKPKWWNVIYDGVDEVQGKLLFGYVLIKKEDAYKVPFEPLYPECSPQKLHIFVVGLRDIEEVHSSLSQMKLKALSTSFDISGDDYDPVVTVPEKIFNRGVNINTYLPITLDVPKNKALCPVLDCFVHDHSNSANDISDKKLLGLTTIDVSNLLSKYYMSQSERDRLEEIEEHQDVVENLNKSLEVELGGRQAVEEVNYMDLSDDQLFRHIAWELPKRNKILPDEEYKKYSEATQIYKSAVLSAVKKSKNKPNEKDINNFTLNNMMTENLHEPQRLLPEEGDGELDLDSQRKPFFQEKEPILGPKDIDFRINNQGFPEDRLHKISEKMDPKKFIDDEDIIENEESFRQIGAGGLNINENNNKKPSIGLIPFSEGEVKEKKLSHEQTPVSHEHPSIKNVKVFRPIEEEQEEEGEKPAKKEKSSKKSSINPIENKLDKEKTPLIKEETANPQKPLNENPQPKNNSIKSNSHKSSMKNSMNLSLSPIKEDPREYKKKPFVDTLKVTSKMSISDATKISSRALSARGLPPDNLKLTTKPKAIPKEELGAFGTLKLFSKSLSKKLLNKMKKNEEHYEDYDTDEGEDLDITPEWMRDRQKFTDDLEDLIQMDKYIKRFPIMRGQTRGKTSLFSTDKEQVEQIALMKCIFLEGKFEETPEGIEKMAKKIEKLKNLMRPMDYLARLYILSGKDIQPLNDGKPNPYIRTEIGVSKFNYRHETLNQETYQPEFYKCYEYPVKIPGNAFLRIEVWDGRDGIGDEDEMIGYTEIDLEDRHFTGKWRAYEKKPIEMRNLKSDVIQGSQGRLELWVELIPVRLKTQFPKMTISPPPKFKFELRTIVWGAQDCVFKDELEKCNDLYVRGGPATQEMMETDVHWRCRQKGSFNWRWKFTVFYPLRTEDDYGNDRFKVSLWDKDIVTADEMIGETDIDLNMHNMIAKACKRQKPVKMYRRVLERGGEITDRLWFDVFHPEALDFQGKPLSQGKVMLSFELMPEKDAQKKNNGYGRDGPNLFPVLPEPVGRFKFDFFNPLGMCKELIGPDLYAKCWKVICSIICTVFLIYMLYVLATQGIAVAVVG